MIQDFDEMLGGEEIDLDEDYSSLQGESVELGLGEDEIDVLENELLDGECLGDLVEDLREEEPELLGIVLPFIIAARRRRRRRRRKKLRKKLKAMSPAERTKLIRKMAKKPFGRMMLRVIKRRKGMRKRRKIRKMRRIALKVARRKRRIARRKAKGRLVKKKPFIKKVKKRAPRVTEEIERPKAKVGLKKILPLAALGLLPFLLGG